nr:HNH endonuclease [uncultured Allomuricauda sp.]
MSRYVKKEVRDIVDKESSFKCSWCGVNLFERHHLKEYALGGENTADNLILLCPTCHTEAHNGGIDNVELLNRKKELNGKIDKSAGNISVSGTPTFIAGGTRYEGGIERILVHKDLDYLKIECINNYLLVSLKLYDAEGKLVFWMSKNRWWVENDKIFDFKFNKNSLLVKSDEINSILKINVEEDIVRLQCQMYVNNTLVNFDENEINIGQSIIRIGKHIGDKNTIAITIN